MRLPEEHRMRRLAGNLAELLVLLVLVGLTALLAGGPPYRHLAADQSVIKVSVRHSGVVLGECRSLSADELARLPANMRAPLECPRERSPLVLQLDLDGHTVIDAEVAAQGLHADGRATLYRRLVVPAGPVRVDVRLKDDVREATFAYHDSFETDLAPGRALIVDFDPSTGSFVFL